MRHLPACSATRSLPAMVVILFFVLIVAVIAIGALAGPRRPAPSRNHVTSDESELTPSELAASDPLEALRRYGTSADAARLIHEGVDLSALGYRPPEK